MKFYHGTRNKDLKVLNLQHYSGKIYLTDSYPMAFLYASSPLRFWNYDKENDKVIFREVCKDHFKKQYKGKSCYIFTCEVDEFEKDESNFSNHTYITTKPLKLNQPPEKIDDCYARLMDMAENEIVILERWEDMSEELKGRRKKGAISAFKPSIEEAKSRFPEEYELLIQLIPELEIKG